MKRLIPHPARAAALASALLLSACANLAPKYETPKVDVPQAFKEGEGAWVAAAPADSLERGPWWELFSDPVLDDLAAQVNISNQNVAVAVAAYEQAQAITREQQAALFPQVTLDGSAIRSGPLHGGSPVNVYKVNIGASWEPDVFGRLRLQVESARFKEQGSEADLAAARLAAQGQLLTDYFGVRLNDVAHALLVDTIVGYQRALTITQNRYNAAIAAKTDVLQAQVQLANAQSDLLTVEQNRAQFEHAIAVLIGKPPSEFSLPVDPKWAPHVPSLPPTMPSTLLQRRPDVAAAERLVASANAQIGVARAGYFPDFTLDAGLGSTAATLGNLLHASNIVWSLGLSVAQTVFDGGAVNAQVAAQTAATQGAAATYRQTVLTAFQQVEDELLAVRVLDQQQLLNDAALRDSALVEEQLLNQYRAGLVAYTNVVTAQVTALNARRTVVQTQVSRLLAAVALIQDLGGGWHGIGAPEGNAGI